MYSASSVGRLVLIELEHVRNGLLLLRVHVVAREEVDLGLVDRAPPVRVHTGDHARTPAKGKALPLAHDAPPDECFTLLSRRLR